MPTSNSTNFSMNGTALMDSALMLTGMKGIGQTVEAEVMNVTRENLNITIRHWETAGVRLWGIERGILFPNFGVAMHKLPVVTNGVPDCYACLESDFRQNTLSVAVAVGASSVTLSNAVEYVAGDYIGIGSTANGFMWFTVASVVGQVVNLYDVGTTNVASVPYAAIEGAVVVGFTTLAWMPLRIIEARRHDLTANIDIQLTMLGKFDYERIPNKPMQSLPLQLYHQPVISFTNIFLWPTAQDAQYAVSYSFERRYQDVDNGIDDLDFPPEAYEALRHSLAARLGRIFRIDMQRQQYLDAASSEYFQQMKNYSAGSASVTFGTYW